MKANPLIGKIITALYIAEDKLALKFDIKDSEPIVVSVDADCCSSSWIEDVDSPERLINETVIAAEDLTMPDRGQANDYEVISYYGFKIQTAKGDTVIDYRNESNGYYGGSLAWPNEDSHFYGGVYAQNVSKQIWRKIA